MREKTLCCVDRTWYMKTEHDNLYGLRFQPRVMDDSVYSDVGVGSVHGNSTPAPVPSLQMITNDLEFIKSHFWPPHARFFINSYITNRTMQRPGDLLTFYGGWVHKGKGWGGGERNHPFAQGVCPLLSSHSHQFDGKPETEIRNAVMSVHTSKCQQTDKETWINKTDLPARLQPKKKSKQSGTCRPVSAIDCFHYGDTNQSQ